MLRIALIITIVLSALGTVAQEKDMKIVVIDLERIVNASPSGKVMIETLAATLAENHAKMETFKAELASHREKAQNTELAESERRLHTNRYEDTVRLLRRHENDQREKLQEIEMSGLKKAEAEVIPILKAFTEEHDIDLIFDMRDPHLLYFKETFDYTSQLLERLETLSVASKE